jgi:LPS-assembly lipoprotein
MSTAAACAVPTCSTARRRIAAVLTAALLTSGCGFALQGSLSLPAEMERTWLAADAPRSPLAVELRRALAARGHPLVPRREAATAELRLLVDDAGERVLSVSATGVPEELELFHTVRFQVRAGDRMLLASEEITVTRDYRFDPNDILGKRREAQVLREAIVQDVVALMLRRLDLLARQQDA